MNGILDFKSKVQSQYQLIPYDLHSRQSFSLILLCAERGEEARPAVELKQTRKISLDFLALMMNWPMQASATSLRMLPNFSSSQRGPRILAYIHDRGESAFHLHPRRRICIDVLRQIPPHISRFPLLRSWCKTTKERKTERQKERQKERRRRIWIEIHLGSNSCPSIVFVH